MAKKKEELLINFLNERIELKIKKGMFFYLFSSVNKDAENRLCERLQSAS